MRPFALCLAAALLAAGCGGTAATSSPTPTPTASPSPTPAPTIVAKVATDAKLGSAAFNWVVDLGSQTSRTFNIGFVIKNSYTRDSNGDDKAITVQRR